MYPVLGGHSATIYDNIHDLVALKPLVYQDRLSRFVQKYLPILFRVCTLHQ